MRKKRAVYNAVSPIDRFWNHVTITDKCWLWTGSTGTGGYGRFRVNSKYIAGSHTFLWEYLHGKVPQGLELDHTCRVPNCVNDYHLEPVTHLENCRRGNLGRNSKERIHCAQGHLYSKENTHINPRGWRICKTCRYTRFNNWKLKQIENDSRRSKESHV